MEIENENYLFYLPTKYHNNNYTFYFRDNYLLINKHDNCYNQYNTQYCDCFRLYYDNNFVESNVFSCSTQNEISINTNYFTNDIYYYKGISNIFIVYFIIILIFTYILKLLWNTFRKALL